MAALILYLITAGTILFVWHRFVQPVPRAAALVLLLLPTLFTGRALFTGRIYDSSDYGYLYRPFSDYAEELGVQVHNGVTSDPYAQMIPWQAAVRYAWSHHEWPLWNPFMLCGDILAAGMQAAPYDPLNVAGLLLPLDLSLTYEASMTYFLAALFAFGFARQSGERRAESGEGPLDLRSPLSQLRSPRFQLRADSALFAAAGYMLSSAMAFTIGWAPHTRSWALLPLVLFAVSRVVREHRPALLTIALTLLVLAGHPETMLHVVALGVAWGVFELVRVHQPRSGDISVAQCVSAGDRDPIPTEPRSGGTSFDRANLDVAAPRLTRKKSRVFPALTRWANKLSPLRGESLRAIALACGAGVLTLLLTAIFLLPFFEAVQQSEEWIGRKSAAAGMPGIPGDLIGRRAATAFLPWYGGVSWKYNIYQLWDTGASRVGSVIFALAFVGIIVTWRRSETKFFAILLLICLGAAFDAPPMRQILHYIPLFNIAVNDRLSFGAALAASMLAAFAIDAWPDRGNRLMLIATVAFTIATVLAVPAQIEFDQNRTFLFEMIATELVPLVVIILLMRRPRTAGAIAIAFGLLLFQRVNEDGQIYPSMPRKTFYPRLPVLDAMRGDEPFRIAALGESLIPNTSAVYHLDDVRGYEAMTYARLVKTFPMWCKPQTVFFNRVDDLKSPFLSLLGVRYALGTIGDAPEDGWRIVLDDRTTRLFENTRALPRVFAPREIRYDGLPDEIVDEATHWNDFRAIGWIETKDREQHVVVNGEATVSTHRDGSEYSIDVNAHTATWLILTECAWRGWRAYIDGRRVRTHYADVAFLGIYVPAGRHKLRVVYMPESFVRGRAISFATLAAVAIALVIRRSRRRGASRDTPLRSDRSG